MAEGNFKVSLLYLTLYTQRERGSKLKVASFLTGYRHFKDNHANLVIFSMMDDVNHPQTQLVPMSKIINLAC